MDAKAIAQQADLIAGKVLDHIEMARRDHGAVSRSDIADIVRPRIEEAVATASATGGWKYGIAAATPQASFIHEASDLAMIPLMVAKPDQKLIDVWSWNYGERRSVQQWAEKMNEFRGMLASTEPRPCDASATISTAIDEAFRKADGK